MDGRLQKRGFWAFEQDTIGSGFEPFVVAQPLYLYLSTAQVPEAKKRRALIRSVDCSIT
jgi:hypothetical protein